MIKRLLKTSTKNSFFLFGARGTGKTTFLKKEFSRSSILYIDLLRDDEFQELLQNPGFLEARINSTKNIKIVIIDEIQKIPSLLDEVHRLIELNKKIQFVLTGSSARKLKRGAANLLAGRAFVDYLFPLTFRELGPEFSLIDAMQWGTLPKILSFKRVSDKKQFLRSYALTYLREEILQEQLIRKLEPFQRFLPLAAECSGKILNYEKIAKQIRVSSATVENYFSILEDTLIGIRLPAFAGSIRKQEVVSPKFYLFDTGIIRALKRDLDITVRVGTYAFGDYFENIVINEISRLNSYLKKDFELFFYRTQGGLEIDLVIDRPGLARLFIEIKSNVSITEDDLKHLKALLPDVKNTKGYCLSLDRKTKIISGIRCIYWLDGIKEIFGK